MALTQATAGVLADGAVTTAKLADGAVTSAKTTGLNTVPAGAVMPYAGASAPTGWILCYGQAVSRSTYATLFTAISTTYGVGDGSTTFNLPDLRGRVAAGKDDMGGASANRLTNQSGGLNGDTLGATGGSETHQLTEAELPSFTQRNPAVTVNPAFGDSAPSAVAANSNTTVGSDTPHNNVQPTLILNYIIRS